MLGEKKIPQKYHTTAKRRPGPLTAVRTGISPVNNIILIQQDEAAGV